MVSKMVLLGFALCLVLLVQPGESIQKISKYSLKNTGGFVARVKVAYFDDEGEKHFSPESGDITLGFSKTVDLEEAGIPEGARVTIFAVVIAGNDREATKQFEYQKGSPYCAKYFITGTTLSNDLGLTEVSSC